MSIIDTIIRVIENDQQKEPLRSDLYSTEQMEQHAGHLAELHQLSNEKGAERLLKLLSDNEDVLLRVTNMLQEAVLEKKAITPADEWLLDNFYLIEEQIRIGKRYLPKGYSQGLPRLSNGRYAGFPRVYDIAIEIISHSDGHVNIQSLSSFIAAYQKVNHLTIGELWAIPIMLRLALIENLSRVAAQIAKDRKEAALANHWASLLIKSAEEKPRDLVLTIADMARENPPIASAFVAEFARKLQWKGAGLTLPLNWMEQHLAETGDTISSMVLAENQKKAGSQVSVSNSIGSLRFLAKMDWREFVETMSAVEQSLRADLHGTYAHMDFYTRDHYRHAVEKIALRSRLSEPEVADLALHLARESKPEDDRDLRKEHVGYYLIGPGRPLLEQRADVRLTIAQAFGKKVRSLAGPIYHISALLLALAIAGGFFIKAYTEVPTWYWLVATALLSLLVARHFALSLVNWWITLWVRPEPLPRLDFSTGIPLHARTLVVVPTLLAHAQQVEKLLENLEVHFLANRDPHLLFGLATDFKDADQESLPEEGVLLTQVEAGIIALNQKYGHMNREMFFLFHRPRKWNKQENLWMGYERKRGKLSELNRLLRGDERGFSRIVGDRRTYTSVKYVITLDSDTHMPREAAWKLVGVMAHPLNQPVFDPVRNIIVEGYGIVQPRLAISLQGATRSWYSRLHENDSGIDPYTRVTSDLYQDVFQEGSFIGKGIYDVDVFEKVLHNRFPENRILSHDLLEGAYARCGFASDVQFYEEYPSRYSLDMARRHRWIRGDWQVAAWCLPLVPAHDFRLQKNPISALNRWKIFDNLRRSLTPIAFTLLLILGWVVLPDPWFWITFVTALAILPPLIFSTWGMLRKPQEISLWQHIRYSVRSTSKTILQAIFGLITLPYEALVSADAIMRTLFRLIISRKKLLEWNPSGFLPNRQENLAVPYRIMRVAPLLGLVTLCWLAYWSYLDLLIALPYLLFWIGSPAVVWWMSRPLPYFKSTLDQPQCNRLRELARKTWSFFESTVGPEDNWLPPDNLQLYPEPILAHRTSPTNIGLALLSNLGAWDFGYLTTAQLLHRTRQTFDSMDKLDRHAGHFYNWYDTQTLQPLHPRYVSTVDSGNLAGYLLTLRQGLLALPAQKSIERKSITGLLDTLRILLQHLPGPPAQAEEFGREAEQSLQNSAFSLGAYQLGLEKLALQSRSLFSTIFLPAGSEAQRWSKSFDDQILAMRREITAVAPWLAAPVPEKFTALTSLHENLSLAKLAELDQTIHQELAPLAAPDHSPEETAWLEGYPDLVQQASRNARERMDLIADLAARSDGFADMEFDFLYDNSQHLLSIGYNLDEHRRDTNYYDLLASEARLGVFLAIAQGKIPQESWFALGRRLTSAGNTPVLLSWSGSMFEYLMPWLVMPNYGNTLLDETGKGSVKKQIEYGQLKGVPWGISESGYNVVDAGSVYQYRAFGVPGLGFKSGLGQDLVIAPYASVMALMIHPQAAYQNLERMRKAGYEGMYGFYEAIDFTPSRLPRGKTEAIVKSFMVHHQGMGLLSLVYLLLDQPMQKRFEADPAFQTALLLLQEQIPKTIGYYSGSSEMEDAPLATNSAEVTLFNTPHTVIPAVQLLSNGSYHAMVTNAGGGYNHWKDLAVTRWREDGTQDNWGSFCYLRNLDTGEFWSAAYHPTLKKPKSYTADLSQGRVEFRRVDGEIETHTEIIVSPEDDIEIRRIHLSNQSRIGVNIEITSYREIVLAEAAADNAHPAFSNLFVQTEIIAHQQAILGTRRPRSKDETPPWMVHLMKISQAEASQVSFETNRMNFIGRGNNLAYPRVMQTLEPLSNTAGAVLDPIVSVQSRVLLEPNKTIIIDVITGISETRVKSQHLIDKYQDRHMRDRAFELSWTHKQVVLRQINATIEDAELYSRLASSVLYANPALRAGQNLLAKNQRGQSALWSYSISGDLPIILLKISDSSNITLVKQLIQAQAYWHLKGLLVDLVIMNEDPSTYRQALQDEIQGLIAAGISLGNTGKQGRIYVRPYDQMPEEDRVLLQTVARVIISDTAGSLSEQLNTQRMALKTGIPMLMPTRSRDTVEKLLPRPAGLLFHNGHGGFAADGREYVILSGKGSTTPLPWVNVLANRHFGTVISESSMGYTWAENAREFRLTPWYNDPITDTSGEAYYIRDEETGQLWSTSPLPASGHSNYITRHGFGYSVFEHEENGIRSEVWVYVDLEAAVKFIVIKIRNLSNRPRKLSVTGFVEWALGHQRAHSLLHVVTEQDPETRAFIARNRYSTEFADRVAFFDTDETPYSFTCDRAEFIGRNADLKLPLGLRREKLSGKSGAGLDPCTAIQVAVRLEAGQERELIFRMGAGKNQEEALRTIQQSKGHQTALTALQNVRAFWKHQLGAIRIQTPDQALNILANGWLVYQIMSSRLWGRSGFYQSGGAFGFRDQLQDVMALLHTDPALAREHILLSASRQFKEGDVQHWWHPPQGRGVRTMCSDDFMWLPFVTSQYLSLSGDASILDEPVSFLEGRLLNANEESYYDLPLIDDLKTSLFDHCKRAIQHAFRFGEHGLPLIGSGDWNDGMNMVGIHGQGESVWLGFFLYDVLMRFIPIARLKGEADFADECAQQARQLRENIQTHGWDGRWYRRAYFDDGTPLGSSLNEECKIDSISQSWSVLSGAGDPDRVQSAMQAADAHLVDQETGLIKLLHPAFDQSALEPGYIKGYLPGVRENGGQYTHAAIWLVMAFAKLGNQKRTWELLQLINPINHGRSPEETALYQVEPYVVAADVYGVPPHTGRGGWSWYTGSAGWMYQLILESFLGLKRAGNTLRFTPCVPEEWSSFSMDYRYRQTTYQITFEATGQPKIVLDGSNQEEPAVTLLDDQQPHTIVVHY